MNTKLELINNAALKFLLPMSIEKTYSTIVDEALKLVNGAYGSIILKTGKDSFERVYASVPMAHKTINRPRGNTYRAYKERIPLLVPIDSTKIAHPELIDFGVKWTLFIPLSYENNSIGVLTINSKSEVMLSEEFLPAMKLYGSLASLSIEKTRLYEQTKSALELRDLFISVASHELNTPLTAIWGYAHLLKSHFANLSDKSLQWTTSLLQETERMTELVRSLLTISKIRQGDFSFAFQVWSMKDLVGRVEQNFTITHPERSLIVQSELTDEHLLVCDAHKIVQVLTNLINNAFKFSPLEEAVVLRVSLTKKRIVLEVVDQGLGIAQEDISKIFLGFYKGKHGKKGMGLGLFLAKHFVEKHKGKISVKSKEGRGTTFVVSLPRI